MWSGGWGGGGVEKWRLKLTSAKVEVEVEAELGNKIQPQVFPFHEIQRSTSKKKYISFFIFGIGQRPT